MHVIIGAKTAIREAKVKDTITILVYKILNARQKAWQIALEMLVCLLIKSTRSRII